MTNNLINHARRELQAIGEEPAIIEQYLRVVTAYADMGHSGGSHSVAHPILMRLLDFKPLGPLTNNPDEWYYHGEEVWGKEGGVWQNKRNGEAFSNDGGKTYYLLNERKFFSLPFDLPFLKRQPRYMRRPLHKSVDYLTAPGAEIR